MKKRWGSLALVLALTFALAVPAAAEFGLHNFTEKNSYRSGQFTDVPAGAWYEGALKDCYEAGLMNGKTDTIFDPGGNLTIGQAMTMSARVYDIYLGGSGVLPAPAAGQPWWKPAYTYLLQKNLLGKTDLSYLSSGDYDAPATREDMAFFYARVMPNERRAAINTVGKLPDVERDQGNGGFIYELYELGVLTGSDIYGTYRPDDTVTRAEAAVIMARVVFPEQRETLELYERYTVGSMSFAMPVGSAAQEDTGAIQVTTDDGRAVAVRTSSDTTITGLSPDDMEDVFRRMFAEAGLTLKDFSMAVVAFGDTDSYRIAYTASDGTVDAPGACYLCVDQDTMYLCMILDAAGGGSLETMTNAVTLNGAESSPKL